MPLKSIGKFFTGGQGATYSPGNFNSVAGDLLDQNLKAMQDAGLNRDLSAYGQGNMSLADVLGKYGSSAGSMDQMALSAASGGRLASEQVANDPILSALFSSGGALTRALNEENALSQRGYSLKPEDHEAYGQASDQIARMFGQQEQNLAQALAARGLAAGGGGAANRQFSGLYGNKAEHLSQIQRDIAQRRMEMNLQRLGQVRQYASQLGNQAVNAIGQQRSQNMAGAQSRMGAMQSKYASDINRYQAEESARQAGVESARSGRKPGLFSSFLGGIGKGVAAVGEGVGSGVGSMFGKSQAQKNYEGRQQDYWNQGGYGPTR